MVAKWLAKGGAREAGEEGAKGIEAGSLMIIDKVRQGKVGFSPT
jgi:hypothetical protein